MSIVSLYHAHPCKNCRMLPACCSHTSQTLSASPDRSHKVYQRKHALIDAGDPFSGVYVLHSGSAKAFMTGHDGCEQITAFYFPGDLIGLDGFDTRTHSQSVRFLETSSVCYFDKRELRGLLQNSEAVRDGLIQSMSHALTEENRMLLSVSNMDSEQRVAKFLLDLSTRYKLRGCSEREFILSMTRTDIANYLGMAIETVSRVLTKFQRLDIISVQHRRVELLKFDWLEDCLKTQYDYRSAQAESMSVN